MPIMLPCAMADPTLAMAPNGAQGEAPAPPHGTGEATGSVPAFSAVLTLLLAHVSVPAAESASVETAASEPVDEHAETTDETGALASQAALATNVIPAMTDAEPPEIDQGALAAAVTAIVSAPLAEIPAVTPAESTPIRRTLDLLAPEFRDRLERVIDRMESEFGYKVEVTETYRSQARQDALFAQGRTEPGPVVTWTRASNHTAGRAADLVVDGSYTDALPYQRLMRIAREEGLRTLGPRDPGHVELASAEPLLPSAPSSDASSTGFATTGAEVRAPVIARAAPSIASMQSIVAAREELQSSPALPNVRPGARLGDGSKSAAPPTARGRVASVAPVASVASVAQVAPVAQVATVGRIAGPAADADAPSHEPGDARPGRARVAPVAAGETASEVLRQARDQLLHAVAGSDPAASSPAPSTAGATSTPGIGHADMSERIARLLKVQDAVGDRPLSQVMLRLDRPDGGQDRVRVDLRGTSVSATLDVGDQSAADSLGANMKELQQALQRHGFDTDSLTVRTSARSLDSASLARVAGASLESDLQRTAASPSNTSSNSSSRDRGARHDEQRQSPDPQRQRSRREQKGDRR